MCSTIIDFTTAKFTLNKCVTTVRKVQNKVGFKPVPVTIIRDMAVEVGRIGSKIPDAHLFKDKAKSLQLYLQRLYTLS